MKINLSEIKNIVVTRTDRLGDVILTLPLIHQLKKRLPDAKNFFLVKNYVKELLLNYNDIDELLIEEEYPKPTDKFNLFKDREIDLVVNVKPEFEIAFTSYAASVKYRIGTAYRWFSIFYNLRVKEHRKYSRRHEYEYNLNLLKPLFNDIDYEKNFKLRFLKEEEKKLRLKLESFGIFPDQKFIIIHPGSGGSSKDLPVKTMKEYARKLKEDFPDYKVLFTGTGAECEIINKITSGIESENFNNLCDKLNLRELMIIISKCRLFISNSTGPVHIAGTLNKNIIAFYPNLPPNNAVRWKPLSKNAVILTPAGGSDNMNLIKPDEILDETKKFLILIFIIVLKAGINNFI